MRKVCVWRFGTWFEGLLNALSLGHSKQIAGWIALKVFGLTDCGCERRKKEWDAFFNCSDDIKLF